MPHNNADFTGIAREFPENYHASFAVQEQRRLFLESPPHKQQETLERVQGLIARYPNGWLARHWQRIYTGEHQ